MKYLLAISLAALSGCATNSSSPEDQEQGLAKIMAGLAAFNAVNQQYSQPPAYQPTYQPPQPQQTGIGGSSLKSQTYSNGMRYCYYYNGAVLTVSNSYNCPNTTP